ncbi:MAG: hypothetical protein RIB03_01500 [Henriciella sp.]|uniref:hypothetical protein n=1 Tax=Henriciella sp. TaxID=1968823 RepID=UPI0032EBACE1
MGRWIIPALALIASAPVSAAQSQYMPPQPGTMITWKYQFDDHSYIRLSEVIASGDDFVVYDPDISDTSGSSSEYLVDFSGLHTQRCDEPLPAEDDRASLIAIWPLIQGATASVRSGSSGTYKVGGKTQVDVISSVEGARDAWIVASEIGAAEMDIAVSPALGMPVQITWKSGGSGEVLEIVEPQGSAEPVDVSGKNLGYCAQLLQ